MLEKRHGSVIWNFDPNIASHFKQRRVGSKFLLTIADVAIFMFQVSQDSIAQTVVESRVRRLHITCVDLLLITNPSLLGVLALIFQAT